MHVRVIDRQGEIMLGGIGIVLPDLPDEHLDVEQRLIYVNGVTEVIHVHWLSPI